MMIGTLIAVGALSDGQQWPTAQQIAQELTSPTRLWFVEVCGDSRLANKEYDGLLQENLSSWYWIGNLVTNPVDLDWDSHDSSPVVINDDEPDTNEWISPVTWQYGGMIAKMTGVNVNTSNALLRRLDGFQQTHLALSEVPTVWSRLYGKPTIFRGWAYGVNGGVQSSPDLQLWSRLNGGNYADEDNPVGAAISAPPEGEYTEATLTLPEGWTSSVSSSNVCWLLTPKGAATTADELASVSRVIYHPADDTPGIVLLNLAVGGTILTSHYLNPDAFAPAIVETWLPMVGDPGKHILWIDMGTNGGSADEEFDDHIIQLIEYWRTHLGAQTPVIITTAYDGATDAGEKLYVRRIYDAVRRCPGVLLLDTRAAMPAFDEADALGWIPDGTHYTDTGVAALMAAISTMTAEVVTNGANHQGYLGTDLTTDPMQVGEQFEEGMWGVGTPGSAVQVKVNDEEWGSTTCDSNGDWGPIINTPTVAMRGAGADVDVVVTFGTTKTTTRPTTIAAAA